MTGVSENDVVVAKFDSNGNITKLTKAASETRFIPSTDFDKDYVVFDSSKYTTFKERSGNKLTFKDSDDNTYTLNVAGAAVYKMVGSNVTADDDYALSDLSDVAKIDSVKVYQFSEDSDTWDVVVYKTK